MENDLGEQEVVRRLEPHTSVKSLGVFLQTTGGDDDQLEYMTTNVTTWLDMINLSVLPHAMNLRSLHTRILKTLIYPLPTTCLTNDDCVALEAALYRKSLPKCGVGSKLPLAVRYAPVGYMGIDMPQLYVQQGICHLRELIRAIPNHGITAQQMRILNEVLHLMTGTPTWIFDQTHHQFAKLIDEVWMQSTWEFALAYNITVSSP